MLNFKMGSLAALYAANVLDGGRTIDEVPAIIRPQVEKILGLSDASGEDSGSSAEQPAAAE